MRVTYVNMHITFVHYYKSAYTVFNHFSLIAKKG
jgi:hypothetical protein